MRAQQRQEKMQQQLEEPRAGFYVHTVSNGLLDDSISSLEASTRATGESMGSFEKRHHGHHSIKETKVYNNDEAFVGPFSSPSTAEQAYDFLREFSNNEKMKHKKKKSSGNWFQRRRASCTR